MNDDLFLLITIVRKEDMELLQYVYKTSLNTPLGQNYMYWGEPEIAMIYQEIFNHDDQVVIMKVKTIDGIK